MALDEEISVVSTDAKAALMTYAELSGMIDTAKETYVRGMDKEVFFKEFAPGIDLGKAPKWLHDLLDIIWDIFD